MVKLFIHLLEFLAGRLGILLMLLVLFLGGRDLLLEGDNVIIEKTYLL